MSPRTDRPPPDQAPALSHAEEPNLPDASGARPRWVEAAVLAAAMLAVLVLFVLTPLPGGDDWETFRGAALRILSGRELYGSKITHAYFSNPPWLAVAALPAAILPFKWGWGVLSIASLGAALLLARRWTSGIVKPLLVLGSPAMFYTILHGQIDAIILAMALLPREWWLLAALTKPQTALGLIAGLSRRSAGRAVLLAAAFVGVTMLFFGFWPARLLGQPSPFVGAAHNLWAGIWPFQIPVGVALLLLAIRRTETVLLMAGSPFLSPYAATSTLLGPWLAVTAILSDRESLIVWLAWWAAVVYRLTGLG